MKEWNGYFVDEEGVIYNKDGSVKSMKVNKKGYLFSNFSYNGKTHCHLAQKLVSECYLGPLPDGCEVDHVDDNRQNNHPNNLQYLTKSENNKKSYEAGNRKFVFGDTNPNSLVRRAERNLQRLSREGVGQPS